METSTTYNHYTARITKGMGWWGGWYPTFRRPGARESCPIWTHSDRQKKGKGRCKNWNFFKDVINVWSPNPVQPDVLILYPIKGSVFKVQKMYLVE